MVSFHVFVGYCTELTEVMLSYLADAPVFSEPFYTVEVVLGTSRLLNFTASANPGNVTYSWYRESPLDGNTIAMEGPLLKMTNASRADAGWYHLEAANPEGNTSVRINIDIHCESMLCGCFWHGGAEHFCVTFSKFEMHERLLIKCEMAFGVILSDDLRFREHINHVTK